MIKVETVVDICDNVGVRRGRCIQNLGGLKKQTGYIGDLVVLSVNKKYILDLEKVTKKVYLALIVNTKKMTRRANGTYIRFQQNKVVLLNENKELMGTRFDCFVPQEFRQTGFTKLLMFSKASI